MPRKATPKVSTSKTPTDSGATAPPSGSGEGGGETVTPPHAPARESHLGGVRDDWHAPYLAKLAECGQVTKAALHAGVSTCQVARARNRDEAFRRKEIDAQEEAGSLFESEAVRRAIDGVVTSETIMPDGRVIRKVEYSDQILLRLLEKRETGSWRQKQQIEHSAPDMFPTRAARKEALAKVRAEIAEEDSREGREPESPLSLPSPNVPAPGTPSE